MTGIKLTKREQHIIEVMQAHVDEKIDGRLFTREEVEAVREALEFAAGAKYARGLTAKLFRWFVRFIIGLGGFVTAWIGVVAYLKGWFK